MSKISSNNSYHSTYKSQKARLILLLQLEGSLLRNEPHGPMQSQCDDSGSDAGGRLHLDGSAAHSSCFLDSFPEAMAGEWAQNPPKCFGTKTIPPAEMSR